VCLQSFPQHQPADTKSLPVTKRNDNKWCTRGRRRAALIKRADEKQKSKTRTCHLQTSRGLPPPHRIWRCMSQNCRVGDEVINQTVVNGVRGIMGIMKSRRGTSGPKARKKRNPEKKRKNSEVSWKNKMGEICPPQTPLSPGTDTLPCPARMLKPTTPLAESNLPFPSVTDDAQTSQKKRTKTACQKRNTRGYQQIAERVSVESTLLQTDQH
jgi:hypothetical protein